jgi:Z1 domain
MIRVFELASELYPGIDANIIAGFIAENASLATTIVLNSERDRKAAGENPTEPTSPFTVYVGGNIVSRGVTFANLLGMYFTRNVQSRLQQDTYIQRARMFGDRGKYLEHFELVIPPGLYADWRRCFIYHRLALDSIKDNLGAPVWIGDSRVAVASAASIKGSVTLNRGEMGFKMFTMTSALHALLAEPVVGIAAVEALQARVGKQSLPNFLIGLIKAFSPDGDDAVVLHAAADITGRAGGTNHEAISRPKGFIGQSELQVRKFPNAIHHLKVFYNANGKGRVFYKLAGTEMSQVKTA